MFISVSNKSTNDNKEKIIELGIERRLDETSPLPEAGARHAKGKPPKQ